jgi:hypothetical protein
VPVQVCTQEPYCVTKKVCRKVPVCEPVCEPVCDPCHPKRLGMTEWMNRLHSHQADCPSCGTN